jgi:tetratricopeptide (TPR) repeat protein
VTTTAEVTEGIDPIEPGERESGSGRTPARRLGATLILVAMGAFAIARFVSVDTATLASSRPDAPSGTPVGAVASGGAAANDIASLERRVARRPDDIAALQALGVAYARGAANGDPTYNDRSQQAFDRADAIRPGQDATLVGRGLLALSRHQFGEARELADRVIENNPDLDAARLVRFDALVELGHYDEAETELEVLLRREPGLPAFARLSYFRQIHGDLDGAIEAMRQAATAGESNAADEAEVRSLLGDLLYLRGDASGAAIEYEQALELRPDLSGPRLGLARVDVVRGDLDAAVMRLDELTAAVPLPAALSLLGEVHTSLGDTEAADAAFDRTRQAFRALADGGEVVDLELAVFEAEHGDPQLALTLARRAFDIRRDNVFTADALAWAHHVSGNEGEATRYAALARRLGTVERGVLSRSATLFPNGRTAPPR